MTDSVTHGNFALLKSGRSNKRVAVISHEETFSGLFESSDSWRG